MIKLEFANKTTWSQIVTNHPIVKQEVDRKMHQDNIDMLDESQSENIAETMKIKSEQDKVYH